MRELCPFVLPRPYNYIAHKIWSLIQNMINLLIKIKYQTIVTKQAGWEYRVSECGYGYMNMERTDPTTNNSQVGYFPKCWPKN